LTRAGEGRHAGKDRQLAKVGVLRGGLRLAGHEAMELREEGFRLGPGLALHALRHHRGGGGSNRTAGTLEADIPHPLMVELQVDRDLIPAQRVGAFDAAVGPGGLASMTRPLAMLKDEFLIQFASVKHPP